MRWKTHESLGMAAYSILINLVYDIKTLNYYFLLLMIIPITLISSRCPDEIDNKFNLEHRGLSHSILIWTFLSVLFGLLILLFHWCVKEQDFPILALIIAFSIPYLMHIIADDFTDNGVHLLWPYNRHKPRQPIYRLWYYNESQTHEKYVSLGANIVSISIWLGIFYHMFK